MATRHRAFLVLALAVCCAPVFAKQPKITLEEATQAATDCVVKQVPQLDDGLSPADTIAIAIRSSCSSELALIRKIQTKGVGTVYVEAYNSRRDQVEIGDITAVVLRYRASKR